MKKLTITLVITLLSTLFISLPSYAQTEGQTVGLTISPAIFEVPGIPGKKIQRSLRIWNNSDTAIPLHAEVTSLIPIDNEIDRSRRAEFDASSWIEISKQNFLLEPDKAINIKVNISVPLEANPGGHYAQIGFRVLAENNFRDVASAEIVPEISASLFITVPGDVNEYAEFNTQDIIPGYVSKNSKQQLNFAMLNYGNVHILPAPKVSVLNSKNEVIWQTSLQPQLILPNTSKEFSVEWPADVALGAYRVQVETVYGSQNIPLTSDESEFRVGPPIWQLVLLGVFLIVVSFLLFRHHRIPNAIKALGGKRLKMSRKFRNKHLRRKETDSSKAEPSIGELATIADFLGVDKPKKVLTVPPEMQPKTTSNKSLDNESQTIQQAMKKAPRDQLEKVKVPEKTKVTVTEYSPDSGNHKTIIVQTSASTIIRQETDKSSPNSQPSSPPKKQTPKKIQINISDDEQPTKTQKPKVASKPQKSKTRSEKVAEKAQLARRRKKKEKN